MLESYNLKDRVTDQGPQTTVGPAFRTDHPRSIVHRLLFPASSPVACALFLLIAILLSGCALDPAATGEVFPVATAENAPQPPGIAPLAEAGPADAEPAASADGTDGSTEAASSEATVADGDEPEAPVVTVANRSVNVRAGPGIDFQVVAGAVAGDSFTTTGKIQEGWWRICCLVGPDDSPDSPSESAWISDRVVTPNEAAAALPVLTPLFPEDLTATWNVDYECGSERCAVTTCTAEVDAEVRSTRDPRWLEINRTVTWDDACGENSSWLHQIDRIEGTERYQNSTGLFLFNYWVGTHPGAANVRFTLDNGDEIEAWCSDEQEAEVEEEGGWTTVYKGMTCHDVRTGMLVSMQYTKRWLFTGEFEEERYERAYFGDFEVYKVKLDSTNVTLAFVGDSPDAQTEGSAETTPAADE